MNNVMIIEAILVGSMLFISSILDFKCKRISIPLLSSFLGVGLIWRSAFCHVPIDHLLLGAVLGGFLILFSRLCKGAIGMGDGILLCVTGCLLGTRKNFELFFLALLLSALVSLFLIVIKKVKRTYEIPFVPFLFLAYLGMKIYEIQV